MNKIHIGKNACIEIPNNFGGVNYIILGAPGSGKTRYLLEPMLLQMYDRSHMIIDIKGSLYDKLHTKLERIGYRTQCFDFINFNSDHYNPIEFVNSEEDALALATSIVGIPKGDREDPFWRTNAINIIAALIGYASEFPRFRNEYIEYELKHGDPNMASYLRFVKPEAKLGFSYVLRLLPEINNSATGYNNELEQRFRCCSHHARYWWPTRRLASYNTEDSSKTIGSIVMTIAAYISPYITNEITSMMNSNDFRPEDMGNERMAIFVKLKDYDSSLHQVASLMISQAVDSLIAEAGNDSLKVPVQIWMDDCGSYSLPQLTDYLACARSRNIGFTMLCQSEHQLASRYGRINSETIIQCANCYIYMGGEDATSASRISIRGNIMKSSVLSMDRKYMYVIQQGHKLRKVLKFDEENKREIESIFLYRGHCDYRNNKFGDYDPDRIRKIRSQSRRHVYKASQEDTKHERNL